MLIYLLTLVAPTFQIWSVQFDKMNLSHRMVKIKEGLMRFQNTFILICISCTPTGLGVP